MNEENNGQENSAKIHDVIPVSGLYQNWFLDYASYVILDRAVPTLEDGLKPVQRRILHALYEMEDGRFHKVANVIGQTMQYHPHGDASIGDALVNIGQKDLLVDTQGNWGDVNTGDNAAAPRYIEARLSKFALEVLFNPQTTHWQLSYDGRKREPITLPVKFPLLLAMGVEGIAVGLATKILPHNILELIDASVEVLKGNEVNLMPDFPTGGMADCSLYNGGLRGGKIKVRAKIEELDKKTLVIREIPYGTTTRSLLESIVKANDDGKIKIKQIVDNTAQNVELLVHLTPGTSPDVTISALYAFTDCEVSISPNACVIIEGKPQFMSVNEIIKISTANTLNLLEKELLIRQGELKEKLLFSSLEKIFIENRIYRDIEEVATWEGVLKTIDKGLDPFKKDFYREITEEDLLKLTEIKIKRISKFDSGKADEIAVKLQKELEEVEFNLQHLNGYAINYFKNLRDKFGKGRERKTVLTAFDTIVANAVAANNAKLYVNREEGFIGTGLKKDEFVCDCSDIDEIIVFRKDGICKVVKVADKVFVGKDIIHVGIFYKNDERMVYNAAYLDGESGWAYVKRFQILAVTRDREYVLTNEHKNSKYLYFSANPNGESEKIRVNLSQHCKAKIKTFDFDFAEIEVKGRGVKGNILTKYPVKQVKLMEKGSSTLGGLKIWFDEVPGTLNKDGIGKYLGEFTGEDKIICFFKDGSYELGNFELTNRYESAQILLLEKFDPEKIIHAIYHDGNSGNDYIKRFKIETTTVAKRFPFISGSKSSFLRAIASADMNVEIKTKPNLLTNKDTFVYRFSEMDEVKGWRAVGKKLDENNIIYVKLWALPKENVDIVLVEKENNEEQKLFE